MATGPLLIRATCAASPDGTRVDIQQSESTAPLQVDLTRLRHKLADPAEGHAANPSTR